MTLLPETKIFGIGLSRTGTESLNSALTTLGVPAVHFPADPVTADELARGRYALSILREYQALTDIPAAAFYAQFDQTFPGSKFILTTRPTQSWLASMQNHFTMYVEHRHRPFTDFMHACTYGALHFSPNRFGFVKELHEANVCQYFEDRPEQLLVFNLFEGDGWEELCKFLGLPVPTVPFPHENRALTEPREPEQPRQAWRRAAARTRSIARSLSRTWNQTPRRALRGEADRFGPR